MTPKSTTDAMLWQSLTLLDDDLLDPNCPDAVVDMELQALGVDADAMVRRGLSYIDGLREEQRLSWQTLARKRRATMEQRAAQVGVDWKIDRASLLSRIAELRATDSVVGTAIKMAARKRKPEESTDEELRALLLEMETLRILESEVDE